jgi:hypothetical protein
MMKDKYDDCLMPLMARVEHYTGLQTNLDNLYQSIKEELQKEKKLKIVAEFRGEMNGKPLRSITAVNTSLVVLAGALREITISIMGDPDNFAVEVGSGSWFESLIIPGATGFLAGGPLGAIGGITVGVIMAYEFERRMWKKIREVVERESKRKLDSLSIDYYIK